MDLSTEIISRYLIRREVFDISCHNTVSSTNTLLKEAALAGAPEGSVIIAESQTSGRGRMGRSFYSPDGSGLYMSMLIRPDPDTVGKITTMAAVAVCRAIERTLDIKPDIKWVNDILLNGKKVCGILAEAATGGEGVMFVVLGIGVNVYMPSEGFTEDIADIAGALTETIRPDLRSRIAAAILDEFWEIYSKKENIAMEYNKRCIVPGNRVNVIKNGVAKPALALSLDEVCRLVVRYDNGETETLESGEISIKIDK
ncbi:MAG: biotin--[acetyl-CoA-carboxylase] ligase [Ruminococcaceae bacterium]|nr:biotin--[acetyl-CoA-carboxylase] ligase [Oscillospiraceae bacterium]